MSIIFKNKPKAVFGHSCYFHYFDVFEAPTLLAERAVEVLSDAGHNGSWNIIFMGEEVRTIEYETTDPWEAREEFAQQLGFEISQAFKQLS